MQPTHVPKRPVLDRAVLVLNRSWVAVGVTTVRRAVCMAFQGVANVIDPDSLCATSFRDWVEQPRASAVGWIVTTSVPVPVPEVVQLRVYNKIPNHEAPFTRQNLYRRDDYTCQYCARRDSADRLSIDHVLPRSKGGVTSWENCVLACIRCNARKADRTLKEAGLCLLQSPRRPRWSPYMNLAVEERLVCWQRFTAKNDWDASRRSKATGS